MILGRSYFREVCKHLFVVLLCIVFLIGLGAAIRASATSQGAPIWVPLSLVPLIVGQALPYFFPVVLLISVVLGYSRMSADNEHIAAFVAGIPPWRLLIPAFSVGALISVLTYPLISEVVPSMYGQMRQVVHGMPIAALKNTNPGSSELSFGGFYMSWEDRSGPGEFHDILLSLSASKEEEDELRLRADRAIMTVDEKDLTFMFEGLRTFRDTRGLFYNPGQTWLKLDLSDLQSSRVLATRTKDLASSTLMANFLEEPNKDEQDHILFILWQRMSMAFATLPLSLIGAMLGWRLRRGGFVASFSIALSFLLIIYYPLFFVCDNLEEIDALSPFLAAWLPSIALIPISFLLYRRINFK